MKSKKYLLILILLISCITDKDESGFNAFNYIKLYPENKELKNSNQIHASYINNKISSVSFDFNHEFIKTDTVVYIDNDYFLYSTINDTNDSMFNISANIKDSSMTFVFIKKNADYCLYSIIRPLNDSLLRIKFVNPDKFLMHFKSFNISLLKKLLTLENNDLFSDGKYLHYYYKSRTLFAVLVEDYIKWKYKNPIEKIDNVYGSIYMDINIIEKKYIKTLPIDYVWKNKIDSIGSVSKIEDISIKDMQ
jgi:hypothetical protein